MSRLSLILALVSVWTYGDEALDTIVERGANQTPSVVSQCRVRSEQVRCLVDGKWETIENKPLPKPWGLE